MSVRPIRLVLDAQLSGEPSYEALAAMAAALRTAGVEKQAAMHGSRARTEDLVPA